MFNTTFKKSWVISCFMMGTTNLLFQSLTLSHVPIWQLRPIRTVFRNLVACMVMRYSSYVQTEHEQSMVNSLRIFYINHKSKMSITTWHTTLKWIFSKKSLRNYFADWWQSGRKLVSPLQRYLFLSEILHGHCLAWYHILKLNETVQWQSILIIVIVLV